MTGSSAGVFDELPWIAPLLASLRQIHGQAKLVGICFVLSHTSLTTRPRPFTRLITPEHARLVAGTSGVIGIWLVKSIFPDMDALAAGMARMAAVVGVDHVGLGPVRIS